MFRLFKHLKPMAKFFVVAVILLFASALAELYLPGMMSDIINDGIYLDYEPMYKHETMQNPFGEIDITGDVDGFEKDKIPVFEMKDGFSTVDIKNVWNEQFNSFPIKFNFMDIPVKDSKELFNDVLLPFMNSIKEYQFDKISEKYGYEVSTFNDYKAEDKEKVREAMSKLIDFDSILKTNLEGDAINLDTFLDIFKEGEGEEEDVWSDDPNMKRLLTSCVMCMKHSEYGNLLPIPLDKETGERVAVDSNGVVIDKSRIEYVIDDETGRVSPFPDYEIILCNSVLGYAYKYENNTKWIKNKLGMTEDEISDAVDNNSQEKNSFLKFLDILKLSKKGTTTDALSKKVEKTREEWLTPDGITIQTADMGFIARKGLMMLLFTLFASLCTIVAMFMSSKIAAYFSKVLRSMVFAKVEGYSLVEFDKFSTASLVTRSTNDINQIQNVFLVILRTTLSAPVTIIGGFIFSFRANVSMTMVLVYILPILFIAAGVAAKICQPLFKVIQRKVDQLTLIMREGITGIRVVRAFNKQEQEKKRFDKVNISASRTAVVLQRYCAVLVPLINICLNCASVGIFWRAAKQVADNTISDVGSMLEVSQYITQIAMSMVFVASAVVIFPRASASAERILQVMDTDVAVVDKDGATDTSDDSGTVEFRHVNFKYSPDAEKNILEDISFKCEKGKVTAIVGGTGSGKSTIINLIPRFYDVTGGQVFVDGQDVSTYPQAELRKKIGFVPQRSILFSGTIADNLRYGKEDATEEEMWEALRIAQSDAFVREKEGGLEYEVEQGGQNFSGGQKQRLSIARAVTRRPEIYIFDDSFSALDFKTDAKLRKALAEVTQESIVIIVAQRIGTIMDADEIIVMDDGRMVGKGKHADLIRNCKLYRDIALSQMSEEELGL
ncbi:MAG: ABC transporter transmembrane domain-containing protein [Christensenellales bacterium]